jgi:hypothetical protein
MSKVRGKNAQVFITDVGGTAREITSFCDGFDDSFERETYDATTYGSGGRERQGGFVDWTGTITGKWDNGGTATPDQWFPALIIADGTVTSQLTDLPNGSASGRPYHRGNVFFSNYAVSQPFDGMVTWSVDFELADGTVTRGTV